MRNIKLTIAYDGTDFHGWQRQPDLPHRPAGAGRGDRAAHRVATAATASGRTDAGVHALGQVVHFLTASRHAPEVFVRALNARCRRRPGARRLREAPGVPRDARRPLQALSLRHRQRPDRRPVPAPVCLARLPPARRRRDEPGGAGPAGPPRLPQLRDRLAQPDEQRPDDLRRRRRSARGTSSSIEVEADGFLYNMVRSIAGTLVLVGRGQAPRGVGRRGPPRRESRRGRARRRLAAGTVPRPRPTTATPGRPTRNEDRSRHHSLILGGAQENTLLTVEGLHHRYERRRDADHRPGRRARGGPVRPGRASWA